MYTEEDLKRAVEQGIFTDAAVQEFRTSIAERNKTAVVDEENFRLVGGFNDIFVTIACLLFLLSLDWLLKSTVGVTAGLFLGTAVSWGLAEFFILKKRLALVAIMLLLFFVASIYGGVFSFKPVLGNWALGSACAAAALAAGLHWWRFHVPITVAAGTATITASIIFFTMQFFPSLNLAWIHALLFLCGCACFAYAMYWDISDTKRSSRNSDVAFWLHLLAAPLLIHPIFFAAGVLEGNLQISTILPILCLYILIILISLIIDRRTFIISASGYVLYTLYNLLKNYDATNEPLALTGILIGLTLLLLSGLWHKARSPLAKYLPKPLHPHLPDF